MFKESTQQQNRNINNNQAKKSKWFSYIANAVVVLIGALPYIMLKLYVIPYVSDEDKLKNALIEAQKGFPMKSKDGSVEISALNFDDKFNLSFEYRSNDITIQTAESDAVESLKKSKFHDVFCSTELSKKALNKGGSISVSFLSKDNKKLYDVTLKCSN